MIIRDFIYSAFRKVGIYSAGDQPLASEAEDGLVQLNRMLYQWSIQPNGLYTFVKESFLLVSGQQDYTYGSGGDFDSVRPIKILECFYRNNEIDKTIQQIDSKNWSQITSKLTQSYPIVFLYTPDFSLVKISFYPIPTLNDEVFFISQKPLNQYTHLTDELNLPPEYEEAIQWNLAKKIGAEYTDSIPSIVLLEARDTLKELKSYHSQQKIPPQIGTWPYKRASGHWYNIYEG
jgi:hypothetical protein